MIPSAELRPGGGEAYELVAFDFRHPGSLTRIIHEVPGKQPKVWYFETRGQDEESMLNGGGSDTLLSSAALKRRI